MSQILVLLVFYVCFDADALQCDFYLEYSHTVALLFFPNVMYPSTSLTTTVEAVSEVLIQLCARCGCCRL